MAKKLKVADQVHLSAEVGLKTIERHAEDQCQKLHLTEIDMAIEKQLVLDLKVELQKAKEAAQLAKEAAEAEKQASCLLGVEEMQIRLVEELLEVCRGGATLCIGGAMSPPIFFKNSLIISKCRLQSF